MKRVTLKLLGLGVIGLLILDGLAMIALAIQAQQITVTMPEDDDAERAAIVFFDDFGPSPRLDSAIAHMSDHPGQDLILVGGCRPNLNRHGAAEWADMAMAAGIAKDRIHVGRGSFDTVGNLLSASTISQSQGYTSLILISSRVHLVRIRHLAKKILPSGIELHYAPSANRGVWRTIPQLQHEVLQRAGTAILPDDVYRAALRRWRLGSAPISQAGVCDISANSVDLSDTGIQ